MEILQDLAKRMQLGDADLEAGYEANIDYMLSGLGIGVDWLKRFDVPVKVPNFAPYVRVHHGMKPACVKACPTGALRLIDLDGPEEIAPGHSLRQRSMGLLERQV